MGCRLGAGLQLQPLYIGGRGIADGHNSWRDQRRPLEILVVVFEGSHVPAQPVLEPVAFYATFVSPDALRVEVDRPGTGGCKIGAAALEPLGGRYVGHQSRRELIVDTELRSGGVIASDAVTEKLEADPAEGRGIQRRLREILVELLA